MKDLKIEKTRLANQELYLITKTGLHILIYRQLRLL